MKCLDCKYWGPPEVVPGSRRVVGHCDRHPCGETASGEQLPGRLYDFFDQCVVGEAHDDPVRLRVYGQSVEAQNSALTYLYPNGVRRVDTPAKMDTPGGPVCGCGEPSVTESGLCEECRG